MIKHINWDAAQSNGIIYNHQYVGCLFTGTEHAPKVSFPYTELWYSTVHTHRPNGVTLDGVYRPFTEVEEQEVLSLIDSWVQPVGQQGNPSDEQLATVARRRRGVLFRRLDSLVLQHQREVRLGVQPTYTLEQLDDWALALEAVPEQGGFPREINWPPIV